MDEATRPQPMTATSDPRPTWRQLAVPHPRDRAERFGCGCASFAATATLLTLIALDVSPWTAWWQMLLLIPATAAVLTVAATWPVIAWMQHRTPTPPARCPPRT